MERISRVAKPDISIITNIGHSHIENLGSREAIRDEKLKIAAFSPAGSVLLLNGDEPLLADVKADGKKIFYVSANDLTKDCFAKDVTAGEGKLRFTACVFGKEQKVELNVFGAHYVLNALFALAAASLLGVDLASASAALGGFRSDGKRQYIYGTDGHTVISDCYNSAPESLRASLSVLAMMKGRRIAVLGDMLELGDRSPEYHAALGDSIASSADLLVTYGELARHFGDNAGVPTVSFAKDEREELVSYLKDLVRPGDILLYKASNGMKLFDCIV